MTSLGEDTRARCLSREKEPGCRRKVACDVRGNRGPRAFEKRTREELGSESIEAERLTDDSVNLWGQFRPFRASWEMSESNADDSLLFLGFPALDSS